MTTHATLRPDADATPDRQDSVPIYFVQRAFHRERQRDTMTHVPAPFRAVAPATRPSLPDHAVNIHGAASWRGRAARAVTSSGLSVNATVLRDRAARDCRLVYTWGKLPLWPPSPPFVVELDNPYVLTLYNVNALARLRPLVRRVLLSKRCAGIVCISEACRASTAATLGEDVVERARVVYPFIAPGPQATPGEGDGPLELLFVGTQFNLKGGRELCEAFARVSRDVPGLRLTVISRVPAAIQERYRDAPIRFVEATLSRQSVAEEFLAAADVFVLPTMMESFGMAVLEAVAAGLPVITTDIYALRELVADGHSGLLLHDPLGLWRGPKADHDLLRQDDFDAYVGGREYPGLARELEAALRALATDRPRIRAMAAASRARFDRRFAPARRSAAFASALAEFTSETTAGG